jgi:NAD(P)H-hydrate epimerase
MSHFITESGRHVDAVTPAEMTEIDRIAVEESGPNIYQMMENAGRNMAELVLEHVGVGEPVLVFTGNGGNGGGGICGARHLANHGAPVTLVVLHPDSLRPVPAWQRRVYSATGAAETSLDSLDDMKSAPPDKPITIVDAMLGYNARGPLRETETRAAEWISRRKAFGGCRVISLDLPTGVIALNGETVADAVTADVILTLALPKTGLKPLFPRDIDASDAPGTLRTSEFRNPSTWR